MPTLTIRNVPDETHKALRIRAAKNERSLEEEVRCILTEKADAGHGQPKAKSPKQIAAAVKALQDQFAPLRGRYSTGRFLAEKRTDTRAEFAEDKAKK